MGKQYILVLNDEGMAALNAILRPENVQYLELQGLNLNDQNKFNILITPVVPPVTPAFIEAPTPPAAPPVEPPVPDAVPTV